MKSCHSLRLTYIEESGILDDERPPKDPREEEQ